MDILGLVTASINGVVLVPLWIYMLGKLRDIERRQDRIEKRLDAVWVRLLEDER